MSRFWEVLVVLFIVFYTYHSEKLIQLIWRILIVLFLIFFYSVIIIHYHPEKQYMNSSLEEPVDEIDVLLFISFDDSVVVHQLILLNYKGLKYFDLHILAPYCSAGNWRKFQMSAIPVCIMSSIFDKCTYYSSICYLCLIIRTFMVINCAIGATLHLQRKSFMPYATYLSITFRVPGNFELLFVGPWGLFVRKRH